MEEVYSFPDERRSVLMTCELREVREVNVLSSVSSLFFLRPKGRGWRAKGPVPVTGMDGEGQHHQAPGLSTCPCYKGPAVDPCPPVNTPGKGRWTAVSSQALLPLRTERWVVKARARARAQAHRATWGVCSWHWARALSGLLQRQTSVNIRGGPSCSHLVFITANSILECQGWGPQAAGLATEKLLAGRSNG